MPAMPAPTPISLRNVTGSWRVMSAVKRKVKIGEVAFRMVARPASTERSAAAIRVNGTTLLKHAWKAKRRQLAASPGMESPRQRMMANRMPPAIRVRAAMKVTGGIVSTPILMKVYEAPQSTASKASSARSVVMSFFAGSFFVDMLFVDIGGWLAFETGSSQPGL
jgi:hypothetical protein